MKNIIFGKEPINKCYNDLFGIRIILDKKIEFDEIKEYVENNYKNIKVIHSLRGDYKATHLYFKEDNFSFQWELQIWNKEDEECNINSHKNYKQDYIKWENESKGGKI